MVTARPTATIPAVADERPTSSATLLMRAARTQRRRWRDVARARGTSRRTRPAPCAWSASGDGVRLSDLAEALRIAPRSATEVADGLQERGLVERTPGPGRPPRGDPPARPTRDGGSAPRSAPPGRPTPPSCSPGSRPTTATPSPGSSAPSPIEDGFRTPGASVCRVRAATRRDVLAFGCAPSSSTGRRGSLDDTAVLDLGVQDTGTDGAPVGAGAARRSRDAAGRRAGRWSGRSAARRTSTGGPTSPAWPRRPRRSPTPTPPSGSSTRPSRSRRPASRCSPASTPSRARCGRSSPGRWSRARCRPALTALLDEPYLRYCVPCDATHTYEQPFRLAALRAGLELRAGHLTAGAAADPGFAPGRHRAAERLDVVRGYLRLLGPATPKHVAGYLDAPVKDVKAHWPGRRGRGDGRGRAPLGAGGGRRPPRRASRPPAPRLLGPFDLFLQARDRALLVPDPARAKELWRTLGRPGRGAGPTARSSAPGGRARPARPSDLDRRRLRARSSPRCAPALAEQAERLAAHRGLSPEASRWTADGSDVEVGAPRRRLDLVTGHALVPVGAGGGTRRRPRRRRAPAGSPPLTFLRAWSRSVPGTSVMAISSTRRNPDLPPAGAVDPDYATGEHR